MSELNGISVSIWAKERQILRSMNQDPSYLCISPFRNADPCSPLQGLARKRFRLIIGHITSNFFAESLYVLNQFIRRYTPSDIFTKFILFPIDKGIYKK